VFFFFKVLSASLEVKLSKRHPHADRIAHTCLLTTTMQLCAPKFNRRLQKLASTISKSEFSALVTSWVLGFEPNSDVEDSASIAHFTSNLATRHSSDNDPAYTHVAGLLLSFFLLHDFASLWMFPQIPRRKDNQPVSIARWPKIYVEHLRCTFQIFSLCETLLHSNFLSRPEIVNYRLSPNHRAPNARLSALRRRIAKVYVYKAATRNILEYCAQELAQPEVKKVKLDFEHITRSRMFHKHPLERAETRSPTLHMMYLQAKGAKTVAATEMSAAAAPAQSAETSADLPADPQSSGLILTQDELLRVARSKPEWRRYIEKAENKGNHKTDKPPPHLAQSFKILPDFVVDDYFVDVALTEYVGNFIEQKPLSPTPPIPSPIPSPSGDPAGDTGSSKKCQSDVDTNPIDNIVDWMETIPPDAAPPLEPLSSSTTLGLPTAAEPDSEGGAGSLTSSLMRSASHSVFNRFAHAPSGYGRSPQSTSNTSCSVKTGGENNFRFKLHAELGLILGWTLDLKHYAITQPRMWYIGCSRARCLLCAMSMEYLNEKYGWQWEMSGEHHVPYPPCLLPCDTDLWERVEARVWEEARKGCQRAEDFFRCHLAQLEPEGDLAFDESEGESVAGSFQQAIPHYIQLAATDPPEVAQFVDGSSAEASDHPQVVLDATVLHRKDSSGAATMDSDIAETMHDLRLRWMS